MEAKYKIYSIKKNDTLKSIALVFEKTQQEIKNFHNLFCAEKELIINDFPPTLQHLYVYAYLDIYINDGRPKVAFESGQFLPFNPSTKKIMYSVMYTIFQDSKINTIEFETSVKCVEKLNNKLFLFEVNRLSKTFINQEEANSIADELAEKVAQVIYPLKIIIDNSGKWIDIQNFEIIVKRWKKNKKRILQEYQGDWVEKYLDLNEQTLSNKSNFKEAISKDWFLTTYFAEIYVNYTAILKIEKELKFPILPQCDSLQYKVEQKIEMYRDESNRVNIELNGNINEARGKTDLENKLNFPYYFSSNPELEKVEGTFCTKYFLDQENNVESIYLKSSVELDISTTIEVVISSIK
ncbi:hypothetical protein [Flavobacterium sp.]|uniref:hypothetical protein n=1 Tax=Flavobacterium sp. TaxID=239 RepID=UPI003752E1C6